MAIAETPVPRVPHRRKDGSEKTRRLTRTQAAQRLCCGETTVRNIELRGELTPHTDARGVTRYNEAEILRLAAKRRGPGREGEIAALAFRMFEDGETLSAVVIAVARTPAQVVKLHEDWKKLSAVDQ